MKVITVHFHRLIPMILLVPCLVMLFWSSSKNMTSLIRRSKYDSHKNAHVDIFTKPDRITQTEKPRDVKTSGPLPEKTRNPHLKETTRILRSKLPRLDRKETPKPLPKERPRSAYRETPKPLPKEPPRTLPKVIPKVPLPQQIKERISKQSGKNSSQQSSNGNPRYAWGESALQSQKLVLVQRWKSHVRTACGKLPTGVMRRFLTPKMLREIIVDDKHKLLYCQIPKVASTNWRRVFLKLSGRLNNTNVLDISANDVHHKYDGLIHYLGYYPKEGILRRLRDYFKFVFVREPFERLLSAFKNKFLTGTTSVTSFKRRFGRKIIETYRNRTLIPIPANNTGEGVTFKEFVNYLIDDKKSIQMDKHWELFHRICFPCHIEYDYIGHLERIDEDSQFILDSNHLSDEIKVPSRRGSGYTSQKTNSLMEDFYSKLDPSTISRLYQMYKVDFDIFNYTIPAEISALMSTSPIV